VAGVGASDGDLSVQQTLGQLLHPKWSLWLDALYFGVTVRAVLAPRVPIRGRVSFMATYSPGVSFGRVAAGK